MTGISAIFKNIKNFEKPLYFICSFENFVLKYICFNEHADVAELADA